MKLLVADNKLGRNNNNCVTIIIVLMFKRSRGPMLLS